MPRPLPDLSTPEWTPHLAGLLERASLSIGRLDARISSSPVQTAWRERATWSGFAEARRAQGAELDEIDIFSLACGVFLPGRRPLAFAEDEAHALESWQRHLVGREGRHWRELTAYPVDLPEGWRDRPALLRALELVGRQARGDRTDAPWLGSPSLFAALGLTRSVIPCLVITDKALRLAPRDRDVIVPRFLKAITKAAERGLDRLDAVEADRLRAAHVIRAQTRPGQLTALLALLQRRPVLSPLALARAFALTVSGAGKLLARASGEGLVVEVSGRTSWKIYLPPDLALSFGYTRRSVGRPTALPNVGSLDVILAQFDAEMLAIDSHLSSRSAEVATR